MKLYHAAPSPFARKVTVLLHETDQSDAVTLVNVAPDPISRLEGLAARNPLSKIPALDRPDGPTLYDSRVICAWLDDRFGAGLYGQGARHWDILTLEATADGIMEAALSMVYEGRLRPEGKQWDGWVEAQWRKVEASLAALETRWMSHLNGPLDMGQIAVGCALGYLDLRHDARNWRALAPALAAWFELFAKRESMRATQPPA